MLITAPASGQGKTTITAALARHHCNRGRRVWVFKAGPDFLDPMILERACGRPVYQLDLWMGGEAHCRRLLHQAAGEADLILVEGAMGLFDGTPSSADLAERFGLPVLAVIDAAAMAQTFGALAHGLRTYRPRLPFAGVVANRVGGLAHGEMLAEALPPGIAYFGALAQENVFTLPDRHLGLVQAVEIDDLEDRLERCAAALAETATAALPQATEFSSPGPDIAVPPRLAGVRIAVARDEAFSFLYPANLDVLRAMGAELLFFSPLRDTALPDAHSLYLPGGYPELHLDRLAQNQALREAVRAHHAAAKPLVAECGGMLYLLDRLSDVHGHTAPMAGVMPGHAWMQERLVNLGLQEAPLPEGTVRGHTFHHSHMESPLVPAAWTEDARRRGRGEPVYRQGRLHAAYLHLYFPSNPDAAAALFRPDYAYGIPSFI